MQNQGNKIQNQHHPSMDWKPFQQKESEQNWEKRDAVMQQLQKKPVEIDRVQLDYICSAVNSLRTQLQFNALSAVEALIKAIPMDPYADVLLAALFKVISGSKKVVAQPSISAASLLIQNTQPTTRILATLSNTSQEKGVVVRSTTVLLLTNFYQNCLPTSWLVKSNNMDLFIKVIDRLLHDANATVREHSRTLFLLFESTDHENSRKVLDNVQEHILKAIVRDRTKITHKRLTAPPTPLEYASPKKAKSSAILRHTRNESRDSVDSDISSKSTPSSYHSRPHSGGGLPDTNAFFDDVFGKINQSFNEITSPSFLNTVNIQGKIIPVNTTGISNIDVPILEDDNEVDIVVDDGNIYQEIAPILNKIVDRFPVEDVNTLMSLSKQYPFEKEDTIWNIATINAVVDKVLQVVNESSDEDAKEDCFILLQSLAVNQGALLRGHEFSILSCVCKYFQFEADYLKAAGFYCYVSCLESLAPEYLLKPLFNIIQQQMSDESHSSEFLVDMLEGIEIVVKRYELEALKEYKTAIVKLMLQAINNADPTVRLFGYRNLSTLFGRLGTRVIDDLKNQIDAQQARVLQVYLQESTTA